MRELGNHVESLPSWHPILTIPAQDPADYVTLPSDLSTYSAVDHTMVFVRGFITCPYSEGKANQLVDAVNQLAGLEARRLTDPLYSDGAYPVVVVASEVELEADGTIRGRDALRWFTQKILKGASGADVAETWWILQSSLLGQPHGARSSLLVSQHIGNDLHKILDALNNSGMFGPIKEDSLGMLSNKKRDKISETLIRSAMASWDGNSEKHSFKLRDEECMANIRDAWNDGTEMSVRVKIGNYNLFVSGFFYLDGNRITHTEPRGKRALAEKFL